MAGLTSIIEEFLVTMLEDSDGIIEIGRNELADHFGCAPSQINYVLSTRFTPYKGYTIESRRGGSGYIKIIKLSTEPEDLIEQILNNTINDTLTKDRCKAIISSLNSEGVITKNEALLMVHATEDRAMAKVAPELKNKVRADILKNMLIVYLR